VVEHLPSKHKAQGLVPSSGKKKKKKKRKCHTDERCIFLTSYILKFLTYARTSIKSQDGVPLETRETGLDVKARGSLIITELRAHMCLTQETEELTLKLKSRQFI